MMTLSTALSAGHAQKYYDAEYSNGRESYYSEDETIDGEWFGRLAQDFELEGAVSKEVFAKLTEGQDPRTGEQLIRHVTTKEYENRYGEKVTTSEHRAGFDATFSAPKTVSLAALVGDDVRIREAHLIAVKTALGELENYTQARMGGKIPARTTQNFAAALFEHDSARPDPETGYAAPQLHTHSVIFNLTRLDDGHIKPIQPLELYRSQKYATAIYRSVLSEQLQKLGYEVQVDPRTGAPEIKGFSQEYLVASSPRRKQIEREAGQIKERLSQQGFNVKDGAGLNQAAAKLDRKSKHYDRAEMRNRHRDLDVHFDNEATRAVTTAYECGSALPSDEDIRKRAQSAVTFARQNAGAREAVVDKRKVVVDALRRNLGFTTNDAVNLELSQRIESGEFIAIQRFDKFEELTTSQMVALECSNVHQMLAGRNTQEPMMGRKEASRAIKEIFVQQGKQSSFDQYKAVGKVLVTRDRVFALEGLAGTGKTTALAILREASERQGFVVRGLAPTGRASEQLAESGIKTTTLQGFIREPEFLNGQVTTRRLYVLDESSLADTKSLHLFLKKAGPHSRILLVGDTTQHQAVEAGAPFEQLIRAGIQTARLDKIIRQRTDLKQPVELLSQKEVLAAVSVLESQGRITEIKDDIDRLRAIAVDYVSNPERTLIISPANSERVAINSLIHHELQHRGSVSQENHRLTVLVNRQDMTGPERTFALAYVPGEDIIRYNTTSKVFGVKPGNYARVLANDHNENTITVRFESGRQITYNPERLSGVSVYRETEREFAEGDRIQFRAPFATGRVKNSELGTITQISAATMTVHLDTKRDVSIDLEKYRHLDLGYAVTSHSAQGQTVDRALVNAETTETDLLVNQRMAYVAISRARFEARIYTDSKKNLGPVLNRERSKEVALDALSENKNSLRPKAVTTIEVPGSQIVPPAATADLLPTTLSFAEQMRELNQRIMLGEKVVASLNEKYARERLEQVLNARDVRRYSVLDQTTGVRRRMSVNDVEKRAMAVARRVAEERVSELEGGRDANMFRFGELRDQEYSQQIEKHDSTIREILRSHDSEVHKLTKSLNGFHLANVRACAVAQNLENSLKGHSPIPVIPTEKLNELQLNSIRWRDVESFEHLEQIRQHLPHELGGSERDAFSFARLRTQSILVASNVRVAEKRADDFERTRHFAKFEIDGEHWSLVRVDRQERLAQREIEFYKSATSAYRWRLYRGLQNPWKLRNLGEYRERAAIAKESISNAQERIDSLQSIRVEVVKKIDEHRCELNDNTFGERHLVHTLNHAIEREIATRVEQKLELPTPQFTAAELKRLEANSITLRDTDMLRLAEREMSTLFGQTEPGREVIAARAVGRALAAELELREVDQRLNNFESSRDFLPVIFSGPNGEVRTASINDIQCRALGGRFHPDSSSPAFELDKVRDAVQAYYDNLVKELTTSEHFANCTRGIADSIAQVGFTLERDVKLRLEEVALKPILTDQELARIETLTQGKVDQTLQQQIEKLIKCATAADHHYEGMTQTQLQQPSPYEVPVQDDLKTKTPMSETVPIENYHGPDEQSLNKKDEEQLVDTEAWAILI